MSRNIGILGGMSPESTVTYYEHIIRAYHARFGDYGYPEIVIYSVDFQQIVDWQHAGQWDRIADGLAQGIRRLAAASADFAVIATNTMHYVYDQIQASVDIPVLSIIDATADAIIAANVHTVGLLGTEFTMSQDFYREGLRRKGITALIPEAEERAIVNRIIYEELIVGQILPESRRQYAEIIRGLEARGAEGIILGCTEIPLLVQNGDASVPLFDTTTIHAERALQYALEG